MTTRKGLAQLLATLGGADPDHAREHLAELGENACDLLLAVAAGESTLHVGVPDAHPKAVWEDFQDLMVAAARQWPERFVRVAGATATLRHSFGVLWSLGVVDTPAAAEILLEAVRIRGAGKGLIRWAALQSLIRLAHADLPQVLIQSVKDRDKLTQGTAVTAAIGYGDARLLPSLRRIAEAQRTAPGTRADAWDAIEAIARREGLVGVPLGPDGPRLVPVARPTGRGAIRVVAIRYSHFPIRRGEELALIAVGSRRHSVTAPCDGHVVSSLIAPDREPPPIMLWMRPGHGGPEGVRDAGKRPA